MRGDYGWREGREGEKRGKWEYRELKKNKEKGRGKREKKKKKDTRPNLRRKRVRIAFEEKKKKTCLRKIPEKKSERKFTSATEDASSVLQPRAFLLSEASGSQIPRGQVLLASQVPCRRR